jgi:CheY-like chemotaxis protein
VKILVADDSAAMRERLVDMLSQLEGIEQTAQAEDGREALSHVRESDPDVVILDIRMPGMSGIDVLARIKQGRSPPVVIMLTNYADPQYRRRCASLGADYFLDKTTGSYDIARILADLVKSAGRKDRCCDRKRTAQTTASQPDGATPWTRSVRGGRISSRRRVMR